jgi:hypothetical protein
VTETSRWRSSSCCRCSRNGPPQPTTKVRRTAGTRRSPRQPGTTGRAEPGEKGRTLPGRFSGPSRLSLHDSRAEEVPRPDQPHHRRTQLSPRGRARRRTESRGHRQKLSCCAKPPCRASAKQAPRRSALHRSGPGTRTSDSLIRRRVHRRPIGMRDERHSVAAAPPGRLLRKRSRSSSASVTGLHPRSDGTATRCPCTPPGRRADLVVAALTIPRGVDAVRA